MDRVDRRTFLSALGAASIVVVACSSDTDRVESSNGAGADGTTTSKPVVVEPAASPSTSLVAPAFALGVASGDPLADRVMLWTPIVTDPLVAGGGVGDASIDVAYDVATDEAFEQLVASAVVTADAERAHSIHLDVTGLEADRWYYYRFRLGDQVSPVGRTRTFPAAGDAADRFRFVVASCQDYQWGHYAAWARVAEDTELDAVCFLGDYVYEYSVGDRSPDGSGDRVWVNESARTLDEYRVRYGQTKADPSLQAAHAAVPWLVTWDDHEVSNNYAGDVAQADRYEPRSRDRRLAGYQAFWEHMPIRLASEPTSFDSLDLHRSFQFGSLASMFVIETREHADAPPCRPEMPADTPELAYSDDGPGCDDRFDEARSNLGAEQEAWLFGEFAASTSTWNVLANPTMFGGMNIGTREAPEYTLDMWDGYVGARERVLRAISESEVSNPVIVTGDWHASFVLDVTPEEGTEPVMTEFVTSSISSVVFADDYRDANDHIRYFTAENGFLVVSITPDELTAEFTYVADVWDADSPIAHVDTWRLAAGSAVAEPI